MHILLVLFLPCSAKADIESGINLNSHSITSCSKIILPKIIEFV